MSSLDPGDFIQNTQVFTFSPSATQFSLVVMITNDTILEATEMFSVRAELITADADGLMIAPEQSDVTVTDEDGMKLQTT
jgi:hypothetical protein